MLGLHTKNKKHSGFTLIEMVVVITIIILIGGVMLANYQIGINRDKIHGSAQELASAIRRAQSAALSGLHYGGEPVVEYRVYVDSSSLSYNICAVTPSDLSGNYKRCQHGKVLESVTLPQGLSMGSINWQSSNWTYADIVFKVPYGEVFFEGSGGSEVSTGVLNIQLRDIGNNLMRSVSVDAVSGRIDFN